MMLEFIHASAVVALGSATLPVVSKQNRGWMLRRERSHSELDNCPALGEHPNYDINGWSDREARVGKTSEMVDRNQKRTDALLFSSAFPAKSINWTKMILLGDVRSGDGPEGTLLFSHWFLSRTSALQPSLPFRHI